MSHPDPTRAAPPPSPPPRRRPRLLLRSFGTLIGGALLAAAALAATVAWLIGTTSGMNSAIALASRFTPLTIEARGGFGALSREFGFAELRVVAGDTTVRAADFRAKLAALQWELRRIDFEYLSAADLRIDLAAGARKASALAAPAPPLQDIGLPLGLSAAALSLGALTVAVGDSALHLQSIAGRVAAGPQGYRVENGRLAYGEQLASLEFELGAQRPFALQAQAQVAARVQDRSVGAALRTRGTLQELTVDGQLSGAARGTLSATIGSFDTPAVKSLALDLAGINPRDWHRAAPVADLAVKATLAPNAAMDRIAGRISAVNRAAGPIDADRIPVRSATAEIALDAMQLRVERAALQLPQGQATGDFTLQFGDGSWQANAALSDVDPARLHGAVQPLRISGRIAARQAAQTTSIAADLTHLGRPAATLVLDASVTPTLATVSSARLALGDGFATVAGSIGLGGARRAELHGELNRFEPGLLIKGVDARLNGSFLVDGVLQPQPAGRVRFELADSRAWGRPLAGRGRVDVDAAQRFDVDVQFVVRSATLSAKGGLGADRSLELALDVPAIDDLLPATKTPSTGAVTVTGSARGQWKAPQLEVRITATGLRRGDHVIDSLQAEIGYGGGADGTLRVAAGLQGYRYAAQPNASLRTATLAVDGRLSSHGIRLLATGDKTHSAMLAADGGWHDDAWRGRLREATVGPPLDLRLLVPAPLTVGTGGVQFGPAQFAVQHVRFDEVRFSADAAAIATQGRFSGLQPTLLAPAPRPAAAPVLVARDQRTPLVFGGSWNLRLGEQADGLVLIERSSGDLYAGRGPDSALGLVDAQVQARLTANHLEAFARIESERNGGIGAHLDARVERSDAGWRLAQQQPWLISGAFDLPTMDWVNAVLSDNLRANVRLGGKLAGTARIEGTPASPAASGRLTGDELRAAWIEQGLRLENGRLRARLEDDLIVLEEASFSGPPRVRPDDKRAATALKGEPDGSVIASGRLRLRDFNGVIQVAASNLALLQRPDRWVVVSGGANIETSATHVQLNAAAAAQAGYIDVSRSELPSLSSDVVVIRAADPADARARRTTFGFDLGIDLGSAFYLRGGGLDTRIEGAVRLRSAGRGAVTAVGTIEAVDGTYETFGQRLKIARGRLNFQGAPENPGLDILALRQNLPVEVGVTITRTAVDPLVRLHSDPPMADVEALSWLVLGRAPDQQSRGDNLLLLQAAATLLRGGDAGYPGQFVRAFGIDELSVRSGNFGTATLLPARSVAGSLKSDEASAATVAGEIITVGKRINDALSVSYEQALSGTGQVLQMNYQLSRRLSLVARAGTHNALDLVYSIAFD